MVTYARKTEPSGGSSRSGVKPTVPLTKRLSELYTLRDEVAVQIINEERILGLKWQALPEDRTRMRHADPDLRKAKRSRFTHVRAWWAIDHEPLSATGRIPQKVLAAYAAAHPE